MQPVRGAPDVSEPARCHWCGQWLGTSRQHRKGRVVAALAVRFRGEGLAYDRGGEVQKYGFHEKCWRQMMGNCIMERRAELAVRASERSERCRDTSTTGGGETVAASGNQGRESARAVGSR